MDVGSVEKNLLSRGMPKGMPKMPMSQDIVDAAKKKEAEQLKKNMEEFSEKAREKFKFIEAIALAPQQASKLIEDEFEIAEVDVKRGLVHAMVVIPEKKFKDIAKIKLELVEIAKKINEKFWIHIFSPVDFWNFGLDSKFEIFEAFCMSVPIYDKSGLLASLRVSHVHKSLVLRKFEKYVTTYVLGGSLVRGEAKKESDVDVFIVIDDTDVRRMSRYELLDRLRGIIHSYSGEAMAMAGAKVDFNIQVYLLTDFWEQVKDAHPVMFTFIRDGIPLYDRGAFLPWKSLLKSGRIKPSPEAIDMFMNTGDKMKENVDKRIFEIAIHDFYWGTLTPAQGLLMLYGQAPQGPKDTVNLFREIFVKKEKLIEEKYVDILEEIVLKIYKAYEHGKVKAGDIDGVRLDRLFKEVLDFNARLKDLRKQIDERMQEKGIQDVYENLFGMIGALVNKKEEAAIIRAFDSEYIKKGNFPKRYLENVKYVAKVKKDVLAKKPQGKAKVDEKHVWKMGREVDRARKASAEVTNALMEYNQRCDFLSMDRSRFLIKGKSLDGEVFFLDDVFVVLEGKVQKLEKSKLVDVAPEELQKQILSSKGKDKKINHKALGTLEKIFGEFELVY